MNLIDFIIIIFILSGAFLGFKRGGLKELVCFLGFVAVLILAFLLKNPISVFFYEHLPFFKFGGVLKGVTVLNILLYEIIAFFVVFSILMVILKVVMLATTLFEAILKATIVLSIPSKMLGAFIGLIEFYIISFICIFVLTLPTFNFDFINDSELSMKILNNTPVLSGAVKEKVNITKEFNKLKKEFKDSTSATEFNLETLDLFLKYKIVTVESVSKLVSKNKIVIDNIDSVLNKYKKKEV